LKETIDGLRFGTKEDVWGWTEKVTVSESIA